MECFEYDQSAKEEQNLMDELKSNCKEDGKEIDIIISARIFQKLGVLYLQRSANTHAVEKSMLCLIKSSVLLNAALVRTDNDSDRAVMKKELKQLFQHLLKVAKAENKDVDLFEKTEKVKSSVEKMRDYVNEKLSKIHKIKKSKFKRPISEQEQEKVEAIQNLQNKIAADYKKIMANIADDCEQIMGKAPCNFAIIGMGSLARKEITPFSDFEHVIVLGSKSDYQYENNLNYFRWYSVIFQVIVINLGETIIPSVLNESTSMVGSWFYDDVTTRGICFDAMLPWASKFPLGRPKTENKPWTTELIKPVSDMLKYLNEDEVLKNGYHLGDILTKTCYVYGDQTLYNEFESGANDILKKQNKNINAEVLSQIKDDLEKFSIRSVISNITDKGQYNVKKDIYRVTTLFIAALGRINSISCPSCFEVIQQLQNKQIISENAKNKLMFAIALACEIRLRWYMNQSRQNDEISDNNATKKLLEIIGKISIVNYFQIAYALQCDISKTFGLKKGNFYSQPDLLNINVYEIFRTNKKTGILLDSFVANPAEQRLLDFDTCLCKLQVNKSISAYKALFDFRTTDTDRKVALSNKLYHTGQCLFHMNKLKDAKDSFKKALKIQKQLSFDIGKDTHVANTLYFIGRCLLEMNKFSEAEECFKNALKIKKQISLDVDKDGSVAITTYSLGRCLLEMKKLAEAKNYLVKALTIQIQISLDVDKDKNVAITLREIGRCLFYMNKLPEAKEYLQKTLKIRKQISLDVDKDKNVATTLREIGRCLLEMNELTEAEEHFEKAQKILKQISLDTSKDKSAAIIHREIGRCLFYMNKFTEAQGYFKKALDTKTEISLDVEKDRSVAITLREIGRCLREMNKLSEAKDCFEEALYIQRQISPDPDKDKSMATTMREIGQCLREMKRLTKAKEYFEIARKIQEQISLDIDKDKSVAITLHDIGLCLLEMNKLTEAKELVEKALKIQKQISLDANKDKRVAVFLHSIGRCSLLRKKFTEAEEYFEKALAIQQHISVDFDKDKSVATTLHSIGQCLFEVNEFTEAKNYLEKALKIQKQISLDVDKDKSVATTLREIHRCSVEIHKLSERKENLKTTTTV